MNSTEHNPKICGYAAYTFSHSPKSRNSHAPDPTWKAQQAFIRATRRGSKKHASMEEKLQLLDTATTAIPAAVKVKTNEQPSKAVLAQLEQALRKGPR